ncbi:hypothetical protein BDM02DRAFT_3270752 [Thelephora ganbajun]|uniref:Uncharacterized protein n=1 Tax=Thelephora ganbajun TaxID=370292 RepID=A0ACB6ZAZ5_THEGA|nr:hypothetical protein BDM02DRAFT_3270752 [Thelephora ganbajun]
MSPIYAESVRDLRSRSKARAGKSVTKRVVFVWSFRELECLSWISASLNEALEAAPKSLVVEARIYVTGSHDTSLELVTTCEKAKDPGIMVLGTEAGGNPLAHSGLQVLYGRPHIPTLLQDIIQSCSGSVSIGGKFASPYGLSQSVRRTLSSFKLAGPNAVMKGGPSVTLHVENFGM